MSASTKLILRVDKRRPDGTCPVWLRITANRKSRYLATGVLVEPKDWNERKQEVRATHDLVETLNQKLQELLLKAKTEVLEVRNAATVKAALRGSTGSLTAYLEQFINELDQAGRFWEWKKYRVLQGKVQACLGKQIDWEDVGRDQLIRFERHLRRTCKNSTNTARKELQRLRRVYRQAIKDGVLRPDQDPFLTYDRPKASRPERRKLSMTEVEALSALALPEDSPLRVARDAFLVAFYGGGIRFGDLSVLKVGSVQGGRLSYVMLKTGNPVSVPLPPIAQDVLTPYLQGKESTKYLFPFLQPGDEADPVRLRRRISCYNALVNKNLKTIAEMAGLQAEGLSTHVARHSFADYARSRSGDLYAISKTLGHSSLQVTQAYLKSFDQDSVDRLAEQLWK